MDYFSMIMKHTSGFEILLKDTSQDAVSAAILGVLLHLTILRRLLVEKFVYRLIAGLFVSAVGLAIAYFIKGFSLLVTLTKVCVVGSSFGTGLFVSLVVYRVFFHRLRSFPGPFKLKVSRFFSAALAAKEVKYYKEVAKLHEEYGDFIRTGPRELCIVRDSAIPLIYGPKSRCQKTTWYMQANTDSTKTSIHLASDPIDHRRRRRGWDRGFSIKALKTYEPRIKTLVDSFVSSVSRNTTLDATAWSMYLSFDIIGEVGFGQDFGCVSSGTEHPVIKGIHSHMQVLGMLSHVPWLLNLLSRIPGATSGYAELFEWAEAQIKAKRADFKPGEQPDHVISWLLNAYFENDASAPPTEQALNEDARVAIVAGSETTALTLACILFFLAKFPDVQKKLQEHLDRAMLDPDSDLAGGDRWTYEKIKTVTYLDNVIDETLRLKPPVPTGGYRMTPREGITVDGRFIPGDTNVFVPILRIQTDPRYWPQPEEFIPERFGERRAELGTAGTAYIPFSLGTYSCVGKNLAVMSLRIAVSRIVQHFDITFAAGETGEAFDSEVEDNFTAALRPLMLQFSPRKTKH